MSVALVSALIFLLAGAVGVTLWLVARSLREQARMRRPLEVQMLQVLLPRDGSQEPTAEAIKERLAVAERWLATLAALPTSWWDRLLYGPPVVVLEIAARADGTIAFYVGTQRRHLDYLEKQIYAGYAEAQVQPVSAVTTVELKDTIRSGWLQLKHGRHGPLPTSRELPDGSLPALTRALARVRAGDAAVIQFVCQVVTPAARHKVGQPQFAVTTRVAVSTRQPEAAATIFDGIGAALAQATLPGRDAWHLVPTRARRSFLRDLTFRMPRSSLATVLRAAELASLLHGPLSITGMPTARRQGATVTAAPPGLPTAGIVLGHNVYGGVATPIHLAEADRRRHLYLAGQTGTGKSTLFLNMIVQDMQAGRGVGVVDPRGELIEDLLLHVPPARRQDVILFDPQDTQRPLGFNVLTVRDEAEKEMMVSEVVQILHQLAVRLNPESRGSAFAHYLRNALLAVMEDRQATLLDVPRLFIDRDFRAAIVAHIHNPIGRQFWEQEFDQSPPGQLLADRLHSVMSKLGGFMNNSVMRTIVGQESSAFDFQEIMDQQKILLVNLAKGSVGDINSRLLGLLIVAKLQLAARRRADLSEPAHATFYLYLDEFQNFITDSLVTILAAAGQYPLSLNLMHQFIQPLDEPVHQAIFDNVGTIISYRVGEKTAALLAPQFAPTFSAHDVMSLERFTAYVRLMVQGRPQPPFSLRAIPLPAHGDAAGRDAIRTQSRTVYGHRRSEVEEAILQRLQLGATSLHHASLPEPQVEESSVQVR